MSWPSQMGSDGLRRKHRLSRHRFVGGGPRPRRLTRDERLRGARNRRRDQQDLFVAIVCLVIAVPLLYFLFTWS